MVRESVLTVLKKENFRTDARLATNVFHNVLSDSARVFFEDPSNPVVIKLSTHKTEFISDSGNSYVFITSEGESDSILTIDVKGNEPEDISLDVEFDSLQIQLLKNEQKLIRLQTILDQNKVIAQQNQVQSNEKRKIQEAIEHEELERANVILEKMAYEFSFKRKSALKRVDPARLHEAVRMSLSSNGIDLDFNSAIYDESADSLLWKSNGAQQDIIHNPTFKTEVFPEDLKQKGEYFVVSFPDERKHLFFSMWMMMLSSFFFTGLMLAVGIYTILFMLKQKKLAEIKADFINNMTHEFKTPIATISVAADAIRNESVLDDKEKLKYYAGVIGEENKKMNDNVESILQLALFDKGQMELNYQAFDLNLLLNDMVNVFEIRVQQRNGQISFTPDPALPELIADKELVSVVIKNLIDNAIKYSPENPMIVIKTWLGKDRICVSVSDKGIGMDSETRRRIFDRFYRWSSGTLHNIKGFGLGLSYAKAIVVAHHGNIEVSSEPGKGSSFTLCIPSKKLDR